MSARQVVGTVKLDPARTLAPLLYGPDNRPVDVDPWNGRVPGPGQPLPPAYPAPAQPRAWYPYTGYNIAYTPRSEFGGELAPFKVLRDIVGLCSVVGAVLNNVKQEILGFSWDIVAKDGNSDSETSAISAAKDAFRRPDGWNDFPSWLSTVLDDILTIDALTLYRHRAEDGTPMRLRVLDGATIKPIVDYLGEAPDPPVTAYQQIIMGRVESEFTAPFHDADPRQPDGEQKHELIYAPFWPNTYTPYGSGPVERALFTINVIMRMDQHDLSYWTDGNISDLYWKCPPTWTPEQIEQAQSLLDQLLAGNPAARSKMRLMGGGQGTGLEDPRGKTGMNVDYAEMMYSLIAYHFGTSAQPLRKQMNRATAQQADVAETDSGTKPMKKRLAAILTGEIEEFWGFKGIEFKFTDEKIVDEKMNTDRDIALLNAGAIPGSYVLQDLGMTALTPDQEQEIEDSKPAPPPPFQAEPGKAKPIGAPGATDGLEPNANAVTDDLKRWRRCALKDLETGRHRQFKTRVLAPALVRALTEWLDHASTAEDVRWGFTALTRSRKPLLTARRRIRLEKKFRRVFRDHFNEARRARVATLAVEALQTGRVARADRPTDDDLDDALSWKTLARDVEDPLNAAYSEGASVATDAGGVDETFGITDEDALEYAQARSAELVGMKRGAGGTLHDNPNAKWSVAQTVRDEIRAKVATAIKDGWSDQRLRDEIEGDAIWTARAEMIARTETAIAVNRGALKTYDNADVDHVIVLDGPGCLEDGHEDGEAGVNGEEWTLERAEEYPVGHPHCRRDFAPVINAQEEAA